MTVKSLIQAAHGVAHGLTSVKLDELIIRGPEWANADLFDVEAKAEESLAVTRDQLWQMVQTMLIDRFKLQFHRESREVSGLVLVVADKGHRLTQNVDDANPGGAVRQTASEIRRTFHNQPLEALTRLIAEELGRPVTNDTGLSGRYDFTLDWRPAFAAPGAGPALETAIQDQLGLRLEARKVTIVVTVIDRVERPQN